MYLGKVAEVGPTDQIINDPQHPYTKALIKSVPRISTGENRDTVDIRGEVPDPTELVTGCRFADRCPEAMPACLDGEPRMYDVGTDQQARCILHDNNLTDEQEEITETI